MRARRPPRFLARPEGILGAAILLVVVGIALLGPLFAPHGYTDTVGGPGQPPGGGFLLGTDELGRDVLSRVLDGGRSVLALGLSATVVAYIPGVAIGLVSGVRRSWIDAGLMRAVDVLLAFPAVVMLLLIAGGLGQSVGALVLAVVLVQAPAVARVTRTATADAGTRGYVDAAFARGERLPFVLGREILPNVAPIILADFGLRFGWSIVLIASMNYLNLGLHPPAADWGLMMAENRLFIATNPWSVAAPAILLALLTIGTNLVADALARSTESSASRVGLVHS